MRRTVKAWAVRLDKHSRPIISPWDAGCRFDIFATRDLAVEATEKYVVERKIVPCVVSYDDGRPAPRKRTKGKKGGPRV
jgi:hypothetical protein